MPRVPTITILHHGIGVELGIRGCVLGPAVSQYGVVHWVPLDAGCLLGLEYEVVQVRISLLLVGTAATNIAHLYSSTAETKTTFTSMFVW